METTEVLEVLEGQISVFDVLGRKQLKDFRIYYKLFDDCDYENVVIQATNKRQAVRILAERLKDLGYTKFQYKFRG